MPLPPVSLTVPDTVLCAKAEKLPIRKNSIKVKIGYRFFIEIGFSKKLNLGL
jgi:hypothetical protein